MNQAGSFTRDPKTGALSVREKPTQDHPEGNRARNADGSPIAAPAPAAAPAPTGGGSPTKTAKE